MLLNSTLIPSPTQSFVVATLECNAYLLQKRLKSEEDGSNARRFAVEQVDRCWSEGVFSAAVGGAAQGRRRKAIAGRGGVVSEDRGGREEAKLTGRGLEKIFSVDEGTSSLRSARFVLLGSDCVSP